MRACKSNCKVDYYMKFVLKFEGSQTVTLFTTNLIFFGDYLTTVRQEENKDYKMLCELRFRSGVSKNEN